AGHARGGDAARNLFEMGLVLSRFAAACLGVGVTPVILHHANRSIDPGEPMELHHLSGSGFAEYCRQWLLVGRRRPFRGDGRHELWLTVGGSAGQAGQYALDVDEGTVGDDFGGRRWQVAVRTAHDERREVAAGRERERRSKTDAERQEDDAAVLA